MLRKSLPILVISAAVLCAQVLPVGTVDGSIHDSTGGALPGITVTLTHLETNQVRTAPTNDSGYYFFPLVNPDDIRLSQKRPASNAEHSRSWWKPASVRRPISRWNSARSPNRCR